MKTGAAARNNGNNPPARRNSYAATGRESEPMPRRPKLEPPNADQLNALIEYSSWCKARGDEDWKSCLSSDWLRAGTEWRSETSDYAYLQQLRNDITFGPRGLVAFELPKDGVAWSYTKPIRHKCPECQWMGAPLPDGRCQCCLRGPQAAKGTEQ